MNTINQALKSSLSNTYHVVKNVSNYTLDTTIDTLKHIACPIIISRPDEIIADSLFLNSSDSRCINYLKRQIRKSVFYETNDFDFGVLTWSINPANSWMFSVEKINPENVCLVVNEWLKNQSDNYPKRISFVDTNLWNCQKKFRVHNYHENKYRNVLD